MGESGRVGGHGAPGLLDERYDVVMLDLLSEKIGREVCETARC